MMRGLFGRLLVVMCGVAAASTALVLVLQERSLSRDLERAAQHRLDAAARAASLLTDEHLGAMADRYRAISGTPQFNATLEVNDGPTLAHYAESLLRRHGAARIAFVDAEGQVAGGAGDDALDAAALAVAHEALISHGGTAHAVVAVPLSRSGRLVAVEPIGSDTLEGWSELCNAEVGFAAAGSTTEAELSRVVRRIGALEMRVGSSLVDERQAMANARRSLFTAGALGLALAFIVSLAVSRGLVQPIRTVQAAARQLGAGDLTVSVDTSRSDEIGDVARSFDEMIRELSGAIRSVIDAADRVEGTAASIGTGTRQLLEVAENQRRDNEETATTLGALQERIQSIGTAARESVRRLDASVDGSTTSFRQLAGSGQVLEQSAASLGLRSEEISESIQGVAAGAQQVARDTGALLPAVDAAVQRVEEMARAASTVNRHATETSRLSEHVVRSAEEGRRVVSDAVEGMETTRDTIRESEQVIAALSQRVEQIGTILRVIDDVTDETALLALNGSIIAAQAGEQGRAFSVVADQLRSLASRVQEGTSEIDEVVRAIQTQTSNVARSVSQGFARAEAGAALIQNAQAALSTITTAARESTERMAESVRATAEQMETATAVAVQMQEVHAGVDRIRTVTREQAEATDAVERSADVLRAAAKEVQSTVALQTDGAARIGEGIEAVQQVVREITSGLEEQVESSQQLVTAVRGSARFTRAQEESASAIEQAARELARQAELLRDAMRRFRV